MIVRVVTPPAKEPITLDEAKTHLRVVDSAEDDLINSLISVAREQAEQFTGRALITQTLRAVLDVPRPVRGILSGPVGWVNGKLRLPRPPLQVVSQVEIETDPGVWAAIPASAYVVDTEVEPGSILPVGGWGSDRVRVTYTAGYGDTASAVPWSIRQGMLLLIADLYENRQNTVIGTTVQPIPHGVISLWTPYRVRGV